ncbi:MAG: OmpH family outer membrane protein [Pirellulales bacterium]
MRIRNTLAALALSCSFAGLSLAQAPAAGTAAAPATRVGVIDIGYIFDNHPTMKARMEAIDAEIKRAEDEINTRREAMMKEVEALRQYNENSPDFKKKEEALANEESKLKLDFVRREKQFQTDKAKVVYETYKQVEEMTKAVAAANQFALIMRYSRVEMDPAKPQTVQGGINKDVVYFDKNSDLTDFVLGQIRQMTPAAAPSTPAQNTPRAANAPSGLQNRK